MYTLILHIPVLGVAVAFIWRTTTAILADALSTEHAFKIVSNSNK